MAIVSKRQNKAIRYRAGGPMPQEGGACLGSALAAPPASVATRFPLSLRGKGKERNGMERKPCGPPPGQTLPRRPAGGAVVHAEADPPRVDGVPVGHPRHPLRRLQTTNIRRWSRAVGMGWG
jgi:hypothetical protein